MKSVVATQFGSVMKQPNKKFLYPSPSADKVNSPFFLKAAVLGSALQVKLSSNSLS